MINSQVNLISSFMKMLSLSMYLNRLDKVYNRSRFDNIYDIV